MILLFIAVSVSGSNDLQRIGLRVSKPVCRLGAQVMTCGRPKAAVGEAEVHDHCTDSRVHLDLPPQALRVIIARETRGHASTLQ
jgi:hypothetical protein